MESEGKRAGAPFRVFIVDGANHFNVLRPITALVARKITRDTGRECDIAITQYEVNQAFADLFKAERDRRVARRAKAAADSDAAPPVSLTAGAAQVIRHFVREQKMDPAKTSVRVVARQRLEMHEESAGPDDAEFKSHGLRILVNKKVLDAMPDTVIEFVNQGKSAGFKFIESPEE
jgi:Fe-S cluster assembly iron-binding protein IscA